MENGFTNNQAAAPSGKVAVRPAVFVSADDISEFSVQIRHLMSGLAEKSYPAALVCPAESNYESVLYPTVEWVRHPLFKIPIFRTQNRLEVIDKLSKFKPTILHCFSNEKVKITEYVSGQLSIPYLLSLNSLGKSFSKSSVCSSNCVGVIGSSDVMVQKITDLYSGCECPIERINMGAFVEDKASCFADPSHITSLVIAQHLKRTLEFEPLLNAVRHLAIDGYEFMLAIIGKGPACQKIRSLIKTLGLSNMVTVINEIKPIRTVFEGADVFIQLDLHNHSVSNLLEAMSVGMAVATSKHNKSALLQENKTAVAFDPHDELSIYGSLKKLLSEPDFSKQIASNSQQYIKANHSVSRMAEQMIDLYRNAQSRRNEAKKSEVKSDLDAETSDQAQTSNP